MWTYWLLGRTCNGPYKPPPSPTRKRYESDESQNGTNAPGGSKSDVNGKETNGKFGSKATLADFEGGALPTVETVAKGGCQCGPQNNSKTCIVL